MKKTEKTNEVAAMSPKEEKSYDNWAVEDAMRSLARADEIRSDAKMMKLVREKAEKQYNSIMSLEDVEEAFNKKVEEG